MGSQNIYLLLFIYFLRVLLCVPISGTPMMGSIGIFCTIGTPVLEGLARKNGGETDATLSDMQPLRLDERITARYGPARYDKYF